LSTAAAAFLKGPLTAANALTAAFKALLRPYLHLLTCLADSVNALQTIKKPIKTESIMFTAAAVAAVAAATAEVLVESLVIAALLLLLGAAAVAVVNVIVAVPSTLSTFVSFVSSQDKKVSVAYEDNCAEAEEDVMPVVIELLDDDDEAVSSDEEEEDEVLFLGTFSATTTSKAAAPKLSGGRPRKRTATRCSRKKTVTATTAAAAAPESPIKKTVAAVEVAAAAAAAPERPHKKAAAATATSVLERPRKKSVSFGTVQVQEYNLILGDHPCSEETGGFPLSLDWAHTIAKEYSVDALERAKASSSLPRPDMTPADRMLRIAAVAGIAPADVQKQERTRLWKVEAEKLAVRPVLPVPACQ
jgi:hypothetical protein